MGPEDDCTQRDCVQSYSDGDVNTESKEYVAFGESSSVSFSRPSVCNDRRHSSSDIIQQFELHRFDNSDNELDETDDEDALAIAAQLGRMLLENKAELEAGTCGKNRGQ